MTQPFSVFLRGDRPCYYVAFKNEETGNYLPAISTKIPRNKGKAVAEKQAWAWYRDDIPSLVIKNGINYNGFNKWSGVFLCCIERQAVCVNSLSCIELTCLWMWLSGCIKELPIILWRRGKKQPDKVGFTVSPSGGIINWRMYGDTYFGIFIIIREADRNSKRKI